MGDRICIMNGGKVVQIGRPLEVYREPADTFVAAFLGSPSTNLLPARFGDGGLAVGGCVLPMTRSGAPDQVIFGIRPEDIRIDGNAPHVRGEALAVEPLGAETILRLRLPGVASDVLVRSPRTVAASIGENIPLWFDLDAAHLFDPVSTRRIA